MKKKRYIGIDIIKSFAIFGVVFIHSKNSNIAIEWISEIFRISVPIFIVFFTFFLEYSSIKNSSNQNIFNILKTRFLKLFNTFLFFTILYFFIFYNLSNIDYKKLMTGYWSGYGWSGQYFFIILFQLILIYPLIQKLAYFLQKRTLAFFICCLIFYAFLSWLVWDRFELIAKISDRFVFYWIPYAVLGILLYHKHDYYLTLSEKPILKFLLVFLLCLIPFEFSGLQSMNIKHSPYILVSVLAASVLASIYFLNEKNFSAITKRKVSYFFTYISKKTLGIFVLNPLAIYLLSDLRKIKFENFYLDFSYSLFFSLIVFLFCLLMIELFQKTFLRNFIVN